MFLHTLFLGDQAFKTLLGDDWKLMPGFSWMLTFVHFYLLIVVCVISPQKVIILILTSFLSIVSPYSESLNSRGGLGGGH